MNQWAGPRHSLSRKGWAWMVGLGSPWLALRSHLQSELSHCVPQPLRLAPPCASPALSLARPHLRLSHCRTTFSNPTPPEYHCPTLISGDPISSSGFTSCKIENTCVHFQIDHVEETEKPVAALAPIVAELVVNQFNLFNPDNSFHGSLNNTSSADAVQSTGRSVIASPQAPGTASFNISSAQCRSELMLQSRRD
ncbi:hypothetical protein FCV25MIE_11802 [Fagus crenata]